MNFSEFPPAFASHICRVHIDIIYRGHDSFTHTQDDKIHTRTCMYLSYHNNNTSHQHQHQHRRHCCRHHPHFILKKDQSYCTFRSTIHNHHPPPLTLSLSFYFKSFLEPIECRERRSLIYFWYFIEYANIHVHV